MRKDAIDWASLNVTLAPLSAELASALARWIAEGTIPPGAQLPPERQLAEMLKVSRSSVRDAIHELALRGLVDRRPGRGTTVNGPQPTQIRLLGNLQTARRSSLETIDFRLTIEPPIAAKAAVTATDSDIRQITRVIAEAKLVIDAPDAPNAREKSVELDEKFHEYIARATQNPLLLVLIQSANGWVSKARNDSHGTAYGRKISFEGHKRLLSAIQQSDSAMAHEAMCLHLTEVKHVVIPEDNDGG